MMCKTRGLNQFNSKSLSLIITTDMNIYILIQTRYKVVRIMDRVCGDEAVARAVESIWKKRFVADAPISHQT